MAIDNANDSIARDKWAGQLDFLLSCIGFAVGLGNIWRFPYLCYKNGGGAFFIPYLLILVTAGAPLLILEVGLGQYTSRGGLHAWNISPLFKGIGVASSVINCLDIAGSSSCSTTELSVQLTKILSAVKEGIGVASSVILFYLNIYYIIIMAWAAFYFVMSLTTTLPWSHCGNYWNTERCYSGKANLTCGNCTVNTTVDSTVEFWERRVLQISDGIDHPGGIVWELALSLIIVWIAVYFCVWRGIKWSGKVVYFTATFPYVVLIILLIRAATLDGAVYGIIYYLKPDFTRLSDPQVWIDGGTQIFFSYAIGFGCMVGLGSYNKFHNNFYRQCIVIAVVNSGTSVFSGFVVFSVLGFMATQQNVDISEVANAGPGLAFITYPKAVSEMPAAPVWAALFFFVIFLVGIDSQFVAVEAFVTNVVDTFPKVFLAKKSRTVMVAVYCVFSLLIGLSMVTQGGMYIFQLFDYYSASGMVLLFVCLLESVVVGWVFGAEQFYDVFELMLGFRINKWLFFCWKFLTPTVCLGVMLFQIVSFTPLVYNKTYTYPVWGQVFGIILAVSSMVCIPATIVIQMWKAKGSIYERFRYTKSPILESHQIPANWQSDTHYMKWNQRYPQEQEIPLNSCKAT